MRKIRKSYFEATARHRIEGLVDSYSFREIFGPANRITSPSLRYFGLPVAFDDGAIIGDAFIGGKKVAVVAQEGKFMGGTFGEVHSAKIIGLLKRSLRTRPTAFIFLFDSGGVRLQEANAGEIGVSEIIRAIFDLRAERIPVIGVVGGSCGCFGGAGIITGFCDALIASDEGRIGVSGPEVIETNMGVEAFDSRDRALVWRTTGGKNRFLLGIINTLIEDDIPSFRQAIKEALNTTVANSFEDTVNEFEMLSDRYTRFHKEQAALAIWKKMGIAEPKSVTSMSTKEVETMYAALAGVQHEARRNAK